MERLLGNSLLAYICGGFLYVFALNALVGMVFLALFGELADWYSAMWTVWIIGAVLGLLTVGKVYVSILHYLLVLGMSAGSMMFSTYLLRERIDSQLASGDQLQTWFALFGVCIVCLLIQIPFVNNHTRLVREYSYWR